MTELENDLRITLRVQAETVPVPERPPLDSAIVVPGRQQGPRWLVAAACFAIVGAGLLALALRVTTHDEPVPPIAPDTVPGPATSLAPDASAVPDTFVAPDTTAPASIVVPDAASTAAANGWVAVDPWDETDGGDIYLVRPGEEPRRLEVPGWETGDEACPAWSPDGTRLMFSRLTSSSDGSSAAELVLVPVGVDGTAGTPHIVPLEGFRVGQNFDPHPCAIWSPDGQWVALAGADGVWVVDTVSGEVRRLSDLRPSDLEWRPGTDQLTIAGDLGPDRAAPTLSGPVMTYSLSTGELEPLGSVEAAHITWSPDGSTLAYTGGEEAAPELWLIDADGSNPRELGGDMGAANHGIGPVWSPTGERIAYQRLIGSTGERHDVVLVSVADGSETVIEPPETDGPSGPVTWWPYQATWSPDGTTLLYAAWTQVGEGMITVPADSPGDVTVLTDMVSRVNGTYSHRWAPTQTWGRQPE